MASSINATTSGAGGVLTTADNSGILNLQSSGTTVATIGPSGFSTPSTQSINVPNTFGFKNRIINGACVIDQRNGGASASATDGGYFLDRWSTILNTGTFNVQQNAGSVTPPVGFKNYLGCTVTSSGAVTGTTGVRYKVEGYNISDLAWGTANAKAVTMSFWVYSSLTGDFGASILSSDQNLSYPFLYTISSANTWTYITVTIPGPTTGTFNTINTVGIFIDFAFTTGSAQQGTAGSWQAGYKQGATGQTQIMSTNGATWYITGLQFELGSQATSFDFRSITQELSLCYRYFWKSPSTIGYSYLVDGAGTNRHFMVWFKSSMRTAPTITGTTSAYSFFSQFTSTESTECGATAPGSPSPSVQISSVTATAEL